MAYAAYCDSYNALAPRSLLAQGTQPDKLMVLDVSVPSCEAYLVRRLVHDCPQVGILRCIPKLRDHAVVLEIQLPQNRVQDVMHLLMTAVPSGEMGSLTTWRNHLVKNRMPHGF